MPYLARIGPRTAASIGKRRPVSIPVNPAALACRRHSSSETSSDNSARSSFHQAIGAIPSLARINIEYVPLFFLYFFLRKTRVAQGHSIKNLRNDDVLY